MTEPSDQPPAAASMGRQRASGRVGLDIGLMGRRSGVRRLAEAGSARVRLPRSPGPAVEAVLINTAGGIAAGDTFSVVLDVGPGAHLVVTTAAAEKVYRSEGPLARVTTRITAGAGADIAWLPQETILFDRARLRRSLEADLAGSASALLFEAVVFGRAASAETVRTGFFEDSWRVRRDGRLIFAEALRLDGPVADLLARPAIGGGARALATLLHVAQGAEARLDEAREYLDGSASQCGASAWDGQLVVRWLAPDIETLRRDAARFMNRLRGAALPRVWHL